MPIKNLGVLAFAGAAVAAGHHQHARLHARGTDSGTAPAMPTGLPACWGSCFQKSGVSSPDALCDNEDVSNCIKTACATEDVASYEGWLAKQCNSDAPYPVGNNSTAVGPTATGGYSGGASTSICTETSTLIYKTTTDYSTYLVTHTLSAPGGYGTGAPGGSAPGGGYGEASSDVPVGPATESAPAPGGYGSSAPGGGSGAPGGGSEGSPSGGEGEECSDVTVTETERTTVTVTAGYGGSAPSSPAAAPSSPAAPSSEAPAPSYPAEEPSSPAPAPSSYAAPSSSEASPEQPGSYVSEAAAPSSWAAPSSYGGAPSSAAPAPSGSYGGAASSSSAPSSSPSSSYGGSGSGSGSGTPAGWKGKRGLCYNRTSEVPESMVDGNHIGWAQTWEASNFDYIPADFPFIPTLHSADPMFLDVFDDDVEKALKNGAEYIFGQNEPDNDGQANQTPDAAVELWKSKMEKYAGRAKLCAPSVTNAATGSGMGLDWLDEFMDKCSDCTIDCINQHWYNPLGNDVDMFKEQVNAASKYGLPVFVGEFAAIGSEEEKSEFLNEVMPWMDEKEDIVGYSYFMVWPGMLTEGGDSVSALGETFCNA